MGSYAESLLADGETVLMRQRQHWLALILESRIAIALWLITLILFVIIIIANLRGVARDGLSAVGLVTLVLGIIVVAWRWWHYQTEEYLVTNRRLLKVSGVINKHSADSSLEKINDAILEENLIGRMLDYGDLDILTAAEVAVDKYRMLHHAKAFKKEMLNAKYALEHDMPLMVPGPPLQAAPAAAAMAAPVAPAPVTPAAAAPVPAAPYPAPAPAASSESPTQVTDDLAKLADLRDSGAITAEEYEQKKSELLGRL